MQIDGPAPADHSQCDSEKAEEFDDSEQLLQRQYSGESADEQAVRADSEPKHKSAAYELKAAIVLREIEGMSYEDIAKIMDCPNGTVRSIVPL